MRSSARFNLAAAHWCFCVFVPTLNGATRYVNSACPSDGTAATATCGPTGPVRTIQGGVNIAQSGDTVSVATGLYTGVGNINITWTSKNLTIKCNDSAHGCVIDCNFLGRAFNLGSTLTSASKIIGFKVIRGRSNSGIGLEGGCFKLEGASVQILDNVIEDCDNANHSHAGAMYIKNSTARPTRARGPK